MKSILMSIRPEWLAKIINGKKTVEIRKTAPKCKTPIDIYFYCTAPTVKSGLPGRWDTIYNPIIYNRKIVVKATLNIVVRHNLEYQIYDSRSVYSYPKGSNVPTIYMREWNEDMGRKSCMTQDQITEYIGEDNADFYAWYISNVKVLHNPMDLAHFGLKRPPQSWQYIEHSYEYLEGKK